MSLAGGMPAGVALMSASLAFSSGSCETENIVGSEIDMSGTFVFPGKNRCPVATVTAPSSACPLHWLCYLSAPFPMQFPVPLLMPQMLPFSQQMTKKSEATRTQFFQLSSLFLNIDFCLLLYIHPQSPH